MKLRTRWMYSGALIVVVSTTAFLLWSHYSTQHLMKRVHGPTVAVDDQPVNADAYLGNPTDYEAEAFLLVRIPNTGDYLFSFGNENYRVLARREYLLLPGRAWILRPIGSGDFVKPMSPQRVNEFRLSAHGHLVTVRF